MRILVIGDVFGGNGLAAVLDMLPALRERHRPDAVIVNAENAADGTGTSPRQARELRDAGVDVVTGGNHSLKRREFFEVLRDDPRVLRPANLAVDAPGRAVALAPNPAGVLGVVNVMGKVFLDATANPFDIVDGLVAEARAGGATHVVVDHHAEATSEKVAMGWYLDGRVTAVVGTHTHVQTADDRVLPQGTAYITDLGMSGPHDSVIGVRTDVIVRRFRLGSHDRFEVATGNVRVQGVVVDAGEDGLATYIARVDEPAPAPAEPAH